MAEGKVEDKGPIPMTLMPSIFETSLVQSLSLSELTKYCDQSGVQRDKEGYVYPWGQVHKFPGAC